MKDETHENIDDEVDEDELYELDKLSLDEKKWGNRAFESEMKIIYDINRLNGMNRIHDKEVNNISGCNLLHDILDPSKLTKNINVHYFPILHGCMNTRKGKAVFKKYKYLILKIMMWFNDIHKRVISLIIFRFKYVLPYLRSVWQKLWRGIFMWMTPLRAGMTWY